MDHDYIEQFDLVDLYLLGKLTAEQSEQFEEHFVDCRECTARLKITQNFIDDLRAATIEQILQPQSNSSRILPGNVSWLSMRSRWALAAAVILAAALGAVFVIGHMGRLRSQLSQVRDSADQWRLRYEQQQHVAEQSEEQRQADARESQAQIEELQERLKNDQTGKGSKDKAGLPVGIGVLLIAMRTATRGSPNAPGSSNQIQLPRRPMVITLSFDLEDSQRYPEYRLTILGDRNEKIWSERHYEASPDLLVSAEFPSDWFKPGSYMCRIEGLPRRGRPTLIGNYPLQVISRSGK